MSQPVEQFGKYILLEKLASGGMAEVYLAKSSGAVGVNKFVAIKRILPQHSDHQEFIEMFKEEAKITVNLNHGNVVSIYDFGVEKAQFFLVMEYVEGFNLRQVLNEHKKIGVNFTTEQIVYMMKEVAAGLDHAHRCMDGTTGKPLNITHRDMSPQNIMVSYEGEVKIIDFGIAKAENQLEATKAGTLKGKFGYMSPEQADGQVVDLRTDIFSLGIVLWELLANDRLFTSNSEAAILRKVRECQIPSIRKINPAIPPELERIVNKALAKDKSLRYQKASDMHRDLNRFLNTEYPEFSPHDFSVFMKKTFAKPFLEQRKKLVEFSKIQFSAKDDKTIVTQGDARISTDHLNHEDEAFAQKLDLHTSTKFQVSLEGLKSTPRPKTVFNESNTMAGTQNRTHTNASTYGNPTRPDYFTNPSYKRKASWTDNLTAYSGQAIVIALVAFGGWWGYNTYLRKSEEKRGALLAQPAAVAPVKPKLPDPNVPQQTEAASTARYAVTIYSSPEKSRVFIDGKDTGFFTPYRTLMPANTPFNLRLVKEGYTDLNTSVVPTYEAYIFRGTQQRLPRVGYLTININNGGANAALRINGTPVDIKPPGSPYLVQADVDVKIQVSNNFSKTYDEKTIRVPADRRQIVDMFLK